MEHTKEPWYFDSRTEEITCKSRKNKVAIAAIEAGFTEPFESEQQANARRIVACVNACAGIGTEFLEEFSKTDRFNGPTYDDLKKQRDELLSAAKAVSDKYRNTNGSLIEVMDALDSAIASAKGK